MALLPIREAKEELDGIISDLASRGISNIVFDPELIRETIRALDALRLKPQDRRRIYFGNAQRLLRLKRA